MDAFLGEIRIFASQFAPIGWAICNGQSLSVSEYQPLFLLIGTTYGGDGINTFSLPNLSGRVPIGVGEDIVSKANYKIGSQGGTNTVSLTEDNYPPHAHAIMATTTTATTAVPSSAVTLASLPSPNVTYSDSVRATGKVLDFGVSAIGGGGGVQVNQQALNNAMPTMPLNYIICIVGGLVPPPAA